MTQSSTPATYADVHEVATALELNEAAFECALAVTGLTAARADWTHHIDRFLTFSKRALATCIAVPVTISLPLAATVRQYWLR